VAFGLIFWGGCVFFFFGWCGFGGLFVGVVWGLVVLFVFVCFGFFFVFCFFGWW